MGNLTKEPSLVPMALSMKFDIPSLLYFYLLVPEVDSSLRIIDYYR